VGGSVISLGLMMVLSVSTVSTVSNSLFLSLLFSDPSSSPPFANPWFLFTATSPQPGPRDFGSHGRGTGILRKMNSWTAPPSGMSADNRTTVPDLVAHPNSAPHGSFPSEALGPLLEQEDAGVLISRGYNANLVRNGSGRRTNAGYVSPPGSF
jgi:hypothetical protein